MARRWMAAAALVACMGMGTALAGEAAAKPAGAPPKAPTFHQHSLKRMFLKFSWQAKERPFYEHVLWYLPSRVADLLDIVSFEVGVGKGAHANVHVTRLMQLGVGSQKSTVVGLMCRYPVVAKQELDETSLGWWTKFHDKRTTAWGPAPDLDHTEKEAFVTYRKEFAPAGVGVSLFAGVVGINVQVRWHEFHDFVKGFLTIDAHDDDY